MLTRWIGWMDGCVNNGIRKGLLQHSDWMASSGREKRKKKPRPPKTGSTPFIIIALLPSNPATARVGWRRLRRRPPPKTCFCLACTLDGENEKKKTPAFHPDLAQRRLYLAEPIPVRTADRPIQLVRATCQSLFYSFFSFFFVVHSFFLFHFRLLLRRRPPFYQVRLCGLTRVGHARAKNYFHLVPSSLPPTSASIPGQQQSIRPRQTAKALPTKHTFLFQYRPARQPFFFSPPFTRFLPLLWRLLDKYIDPK